MRQAWAAGQVHAIRTISRDPGHALVVNRSGTGRAAFRAHFATAQRHDDGSRDASEVREQHGRPSEANPHPHPDGSGALIASTTASSRTTTASRSRQEGIAFALIPILRRSSSIPFTEDLR